jgi:hypothetical protein
VGGWVDRKDKDDTQPNANKSRGSIAHATATTTPMPTHLHLAEGDLVRQGVVGARGRHNRLCKHAGHVLGRGVAGGVGPGLELLGLWVG